MLETGRGVRARRTREHGGDVATTRKRFGCAPEAVFAVLADGWLYPSWVVGASRMRDVSDSWPAPGATLAHSVGAWPLLLNDSTTCELWDPPRRTILTAKGRPFGEARVELLVTPVPNGCEVEMREYAVRGPARLIPRRIESSLIGLRNAETLRRLRFLAEGRAPGRAARPRQEPPTQSNEDA